MIVVVTEFLRVGKTYQHQPVLNEVSFKVEGGTFSVIFGPPGCGKSVLLRLLTGLERPTSGSIRMRGVDVTKLTPGEREIGYVPQSFALYPHYKVADNIAYPLKLMGAPRAKIESAVKKVAEMLRIQPLLNKYPEQLSGGEKQRVALARGITKRSEIYVFDDPLSGLDFKLREQLIDDLKLMQQNIGATLIYTTSDPLEALMLAEQVFILDGGTILESGPVEGVYYNAARAKSFELLGFPKANTLAGKLLAGRGKPMCATDLFEFPVRFIGEERAEEPERGITVAIKPEAVKFGSGAARETVTIEAGIVLKEDLGGEMVVHLDAQGVRLLSVVRQDEAHLITDEHVNVHISLKDLVIFSSGDGFRIAQGGA